MRPAFQPRFDGPPNYFRSPPGSSSGIPEPPGIFDEPPHHLRHHRRDDRRQFRPEFGGEEGVEHTPDRRDRQTRWGNSPISGEVYNKQAEIPDENAEPEGNDDVVELDDDNEVEHGKSLEDGCETPLHDEPRETSAEMDDVNNASITEGDDMEEENSDVQE